MQFAKKLLPICFGNLSGYVLGSVVTLAAVVSVVVMATAIVSMVATSTVAMSVATMSMVAMSAVTMATVVMSTVARPFTLGSEAVPICWISRGLWLSPREQFLKVQLLEWMCAW